MKKFMGAFLMTAFFIGTATAEEIKLSMPDKLNPVSLMHALNMRHSTKIFDTKEVDQKTLSSLLWAAFGVNRTTGERTIPTAMNEKDLKLFVIKKDGAFLFDGENHKLISVLNEDIRPIFQTQEYMKNVPIVLLWTSSNKEYGALHAGSSYQNVSLFCEAHKMGGVVRGFFDKSKVKEALKLKLNEEVLISMAVGYPVFDEMDDKDVPENQVKTDLGLTDPVSLKVNKTPESIMKIPETPVINNETNPAQPIIGSTVK